MLKLVWHHQRTLNGILLSSTQTGCNQTCQSASARLVPLKKFLELDCYVSPHVR